MREILFRGKRLDNGEWVQGDLQQWLDAVYISSDNKGWYSKTNYLVNAATVGQYTGVTASGAKVFEGDIVAARITSPSGGYTGVWEVDYHTKYGYFYLKKEKNNLLFDGNWSYGVTKLEVIGNIHDNPELLKGGATDEG